MAHKCGFTLNALTGTLRGSGFASVAGLRRQTHYDLFAIGFKNNISEEALREAAIKHFPDHKPS